MKKRILWSFLIFFFIESSTVQEARANWNYTFIPSASLGLEYDSNIYNTTSNKKSSFSYRGKLAFPFRAESEITQVGINYRTNRFQYNSNRDANYGNHFFNLDASHSMTRRLNLSLTDRYSITKTTDRILESGNDEGELGIIEERNRRKSNAVTGSIKYSLSSKASISLSATSSFNRYSFANRYDSTTNGGTFSLNYNLNPPNTFFITSNLRRGNYERSDRQFTENAVYRLLGLDPVTLNPIYELLFTNEFDDSENFSAYLGWTHRFSSTLSFTLSGGSSRSKDTQRDLSLKGDNSATEPLVFSHPLPMGSEVQYLSGTSTTINDPNKLEIQFVSFSTTGNVRKNSGAIYNFNITKTFQSSSLSFTIGQDTYERSAFGGTSVRRTYKADYTQNFSDRLNFFLNGSFLNNENKTGTINDKYNTLRTGIGLNFAVTRKLSSKLSWNHSEQKREIQGAVSEKRRKRDLVSLLFTYRWPIER